MKNETICEETPINKHESEVAESDGENGGGARNKLVGLGLIFGALSGCMLATLALVVRILIKEVNGNMIAWARAIVTLAIMFPIVVMKRGKNIFGRSIKEFLILLMISIMGSIIMVLTSISLNFVHIADVQTTLALSPAFVLIINGIFFCKICKWTDAIILLLCLLGVVMCLHPPFIFGLNFRHDQSFFVGLLFVILSAISRAIIYIAVGYLKDLNTYVKLFWSNSGQVIPLTCYILILQSFEFPSSLKVYIYFILVGVLALLAYLSYILGTYFDSPFMVSIGITFDIPLSFVYDAVIFNDDVEIWSVIGAILIALSIIGSASLKLYLKNSE